MIILGIDPGTIFSGYVVLDTAKKSLLDFTHEIENSALALKITSSWVHGIDECAIEYIASYGMPLDDLTLRTQYYVGYFAATFQIYSRNRPVHLFYRKTILANLCGTSKAQDKNVKASLCNKFGEPCYPKRPVGALRGVKDHAWSALAVAQTRAEGVIGVNYTWGLGDASSER